MKVWGNFEIWLVNIDDFLPFCVVVSFNVGGLFFWPLYLITVV